MRLCLAPLPCLFVPVRSNRKYRIARATAASCISTDKSRAILGQKYHPLPNTLQNIHKYGANMVNNLLTSGQSYADFTQQRQIVPALTDNFHGLFLPDAQTHRWFLQRHEAGEAGRPGLLQCKIGSYGLMVSDIKPAGALDAELRRCYSAGTAKGL